MRIAYVLLVVLQLNPIVRADEPGMITLLESGYKIGLLDPGLAQHGAFESIKMLLPPKGGFASNINIQHQSFPGTLSEYAAISEAGVKQANLTLTNAKIENGAYIAEATGRVPGALLELRFYFKAIKSGDNVILATATIPSSRWETESELLVPIVNSLAPAAR